MLQPGQTREAKFNLFLDSRGIEEGAKKASKGFESMGASVSKLDKSTADFTQTIDVNATSLEKLNGSVAGLERSALSTIKGFDALEPRYKVQTELADELAVTNERLAGRLTGLDKAFSPVVGTLDKFTATTERVLEKEKAFDKMTESIQIFNKGEKLEKGLKFASKAFKDMSVQLAGLGKEGEQISKVFEGISDMFGKGALVVDIVDKIEDVKDAIKSAKDLIVDVKESVEDVAVVVAPAGGALLMLADNIMKVNIASLALMKTTKGLTKQLATAVWKTPLYGITSLITAVGTLTPLVVDLQAQVNELFRGFETMNMAGVDTTLAQISLNLGAMGENLLFNIQATKQFVSTAVGEFQKLEDSVNYLRTLSVGAAYSVQELTGALQGLATDGLGNAISSAELGISVYNNLSAGIGAAKGQIQDALEVSKTAAQYAIATGGNLESIQQALIFTSQAYNLKASEAADTMALLDGVVQQGITNAQELSANIGSLSAIAASAGIEIKDMLSAVAIGTKTLGGDAYLAMQRLIESLSSMAPQSKQALQEYGLVINEQTLKTDGLYKTMQKLKSATQGNVEALRTIIPESIAFRGALALMGTSAEDAQTVIAGLSESTGKDIEEMFDRSQETIEQRSAALANGFSEVFASAGQEILKSGLFDQGLKAVENLLGYFQNMPEWMQKAVGGIIAFNYGLEKTAGVAGTVVKILFTIAGVIASFRFMEIANGFRLAFGAQTVKDLGLVQRLLFGMNGALRGALGLQTDYAQKAGLLTAILDTHTGAIGLAKDGLNKLSFGLLFARKNTDAMVVSQLRQKAVMDILNATSIKSAVAGIKSLTASFGMATAGAGGLTAASATLKVVSTGLGAVVSKLTLIFKGFWAAITGPIGLLGVAVAGLGTLAMILRDLIPGLGGASDKSKKLASGFSNLSGSVDLATQKLNGFNAAQEEMGEKAKKFDGFASNFILRPLNGVVNLLADSIPNALGFLTRVAKKQASLIAGFFKVMTGGVVDFTQHVEDGTNSALGFIEGWKEGSTGRINGWFEGIKKGWQEVIDADLMEQYEQQLIGINALHQDSVNVLMQLGKGQNIVNDALAKEKELLAEMEVQVQKRLSKLGDNRADNLERDRILGALEQQRKTVEEFDNLNKSFISASQQTAAINQEQVDVIMRGNKEAAMSFVERRKITINQLKQQAAQAKEAGKLELAASKEARVKEMEEMNSRAEREMESANRHIQTMFNFRVQIEGASKDIRTTLAESLGDAATDGTINKFLSDIEKAASTAQGVQAGILETRMQTTRSAKELLTSIVDLGEQYRNEEGKLSEFQNRRINSTVASIKELTFALDDVEEALNDPTVDFDPEAFRSKIMSAVNEGMNLSEELGDNSPLKQIVQFLEQEEVEITDERGNPIKAALMKMLSPQQLQEVLEIKKQIVEEDLENTVKPYERINETLEHQLKLGEITRNDLLKTQQKNNQARRNAEVKAQKEYLALLKESVGENHKTYKESYNELIKMQRQHKEEVLAEEEALFQERYRIQESALGREIDLKERALIDGATRAELEGVKELNRKSLTLRQQRIQEELGKEKEGSDRALELQGELIEAVNELQRFDQERRVQRVQEGLEVQLQAQSQAQQNLEMELAKSNKSREDYEKKSFAITQQGIMARTTAARTELSMLEKGSQEYTAKLGELSSLQLEFQKNVTANAVKELNTSLEVSKNEMTATIQEMEGQLSSRETVLASRQMELDLRRSNVELLRAESELESGLLQNQASRTGDIVQKAQIAYQIKVRQLDLQEKELDLQVETEKLQLESNKANLEKERVQVRINELKLGESELTLRNQLAIASLNNESATVVRSLELQLEAMSQQRTQLGAQSLLIERRIAQEEKLSARSLEVVERRRELSKANGILEREMAQQELISAQYEKQLQIARVAGAELELNAAEQGAAIEKVTQAYGRQLDLLSKQKEIFSAIAETLLAETQMIGELSKSQNAQVRMQKEQNQLKLDALDRQQIIERQLFEMQQKQALIAQQRAVIEAKITENKQQQVVMEAQIEAQRTLANRQASDEEKKLALIAAQNARMQLKFSQANSELSRQQLEDTKAIQDLERQGFDRQQRSARRGVEFEAARSTRGGRDDANLRRQLKWEREQDKREYNNFKFTKTSAGDLPEYDLKTLLSAAPMVNYQELTQSLSGGVEGLVQGAKQLNIAADNLSTNTSTGSRAVTVNINVPTTINIEGGSQKEQGKFFGEQMTKYINDLAKEVERRIG